MYTPKDIDDILQNRREGEVLEFKEKKSNFDSRERSDYCAAIANCGGGRLLLGVADDRRIVGTTVYSGSISKIPQEVFQAIGVTISAEEVHHSLGRVVIFDILSRPAGKAVRSNGHYAYPVRRGESLVEMSESELRDALNELRPDFSATIIPELSIAGGLDSNAVLSFRKLRAEKTRSPRIETDLLERVLSDAGLLIDGKSTFACLVLLGKEEKIQNLAPQAEIIYEWRTKEAQVNYDFRKTWRGPFFAIYDDIWETINARNIRMPFQEGFIQHEIFAFDEKVCREAVNNAVAHRDYMITEASIFIHASPERFSVTSPGGFLPGITPENVIEQMPRWRNRRIADALEHTKFVERSGQGMDDIFEMSIRQGKGLPDFKGTDTRTVRINIPATVKDQGFVQYLEKIANEKQITLGLDEIIELEKLREHGALSDLRFKERFLELGIVEKIGRTSGRKYMLSHHYYTYEKRPGAYTRIKGITRDTRKELILDHLKRGNGTAADFLDAFSDLSRRDVSNLLQELKRDGKVRHEGTRRSGHWILTGSNNGS